MPIQRIALLTVHTSPLAPLGGKKTGGMNVYIRHLAAELGRIGIEVDIFTRRTTLAAPDVDYSLGDNVRVIRVNAGPPTVLDPNAVYDYVSQFAAGVIAFNTREGGRQYDVIYSHYWLSGWVANKLNEVWGTPFVQMFHTLGHMKNRIQAGVPMMMQDARVKTETEITRWADRIIAATPAEQAQLLWLYRADRRKIDIVPPGVDPERFRPIPTAHARDQLGINPECNLFLFVGRIERLKAIDTILQAVDLLRRENKPLMERTCFAIIGGDPKNPADEEIQRLKSVAQELKIEHLVDFLGAKNHEELRLYYAAASAVIVPSDYESFGMVALEAMAAGTPVIASEVGGLAFLVQDQETGLLMPVRDPKALAAGIVSILADSEKHRLLGENAAQLAEQYAWQRIVERLLPIFEDVVSRHRRQASVS